VLSEVAVGSSNTSEVVDPAYAETANVRVVVIDGDKVPEPVRTRLIVSAAVPVERIFTHAIPLLKSLAPSTTEVVV